VGLSIQAICKYLEGALTLWDLKISSVQFALNTRVTELHGSVPFSVFFGRSFPAFRRAVLPSLENQPNPDEASQFIVPLQDSDQQYVNRYQDWNSVVEQLESIVYPALRELRDKVNARRVERFNKTHRIVSFRVGSYVMAIDPIRANKLEPRYEGPYKIVRRNRGGAYTLMDHDGTLLSRNYAPPQLMAVPSPTNPADHNEVLIVERIITHRKKGNNFEYLVKWKSFDETENTWEPASSFFDVSPIVIYWRTQAAPVSVSATMPESAHKP
jgi:hypothetical protein